MTQRTFRQFVIEYITENPGASTIDVKRAAETAGWCFETAEVRYHLEVFQMTGDKIAERYDEDADLTGWHPA